jgi:uncharacterized protein (TIGR02453 family)
MTALPIVPARIYESGFDFLNALRNNNERDWFNANKTTFETEQQKIEAFAGALLAELSKSDVIETPSGRKSLYRIYRDTRFSKDKTPYKTHWSGSFKRATKYRRGGYYFHIEQGDSFFAGGFWGPSKEDLKLIRDNIAFDAGPLREILNTESFVSTFGALRGEQLKTTPKGFAADDEAIDLLRYKQFLLIRKFSDEEVLGEDFLSRAAETFVNMRPFLDFMTEILTTDSNGLEI